MNRRSFFGFLLGATATSVVPQLLAKDASVLDYKSPPELPLFALEMYNQAKAKMSLNMRLMRRSLWKTK
jgi:hypothetical protein